MKYETPQLTMLTPAINVIQATKQFPVDELDSPRMTEVAIGAYPDWE